MDAVRWHEESADGIGTAISADLAAPSGHPFHRFPVMESERRTYWAGPRQRPETAACTPDHAIRPDHWIQNNIHIVYSINDTIDRPEFPFQSLSQFPIV